MITPKATVLAYAKLNLTLEIVGQRDDGYHEISSVLQTISLADRLTFLESTHLRLHCCAPGLEPEHNSVLLAARLLLHRTGAGLGADITLEKRIPLASGLGGGSADAAATLWVLNRLWKLRLGDEDLMELAARLGSDVPFFLEGGTAWAQGRGERMAPLAPARERWFLLVCPRLIMPEKTRAMYRLLEPRHWTAGEATRALVSRIEQGRSIREAYLWNAFDGVAPDAFPAVGHWRRVMLEAAPSRPHVTGSGPALYIPVDSEEHGAAVARAVAAAEPGDDAEVFVVRTTASARQVLECSV